MKKEKVLQTLDSLPDDFKTEELIEKLIFIEKVEQGLQDVEDGKEKSFEDLN
jgi:hypothetical protein